MNQLKLAVIGQGYVGLPVSMRAVEVGYTVVGVDLDVNRVRALKAGTSFVEDISDAVLAQSLESGSYLPTDDYKETAGFDFAVITVPTPLKDTLPDLTFIEKSAQSISEHLTPGATVVLESTTYPGTTEELLVPILEQGSGLKAGKDFFVGYSPERIDPGNPVWNFTNTPKVVSGINPESLEKVSTFYNSLVEKTVPVGTPKEAEMTKLLENTFRHVNIALVNELAIFAHALGVNVWEAIDAASTKPFGFMKFTPGPGVGGHCLPVDPSYLSWQVKKKLGSNFRFVELANDVNEHMPDYVVQRAIRLLNEQSIALNDSEILIVGLAYKRDSGDIRESPALRIAELLSEFGAKVSGYDPHVESYRWPGDVERVEFTAEILDTKSLVILITDHSEVDWDLLTKSTIPVLDTRNKLNGNNINVL